MKLTKGSKNIFGQKKYEVFIAPRDWREPLEKPKTNRAKKVAFLGFLHLW